METVGSFEAKTHFSRRLDRVARGEEIAITKEPSENNDPQQS
jgi:antitoxin (DNA-binding transcriptional repressor) of toxin-antitoxin stability system